MDPARWQRIEELYHVALARPLTERAEFLSSSCGDDHALRSEVESLLEAHEVAGEFLSHPDFNLGLRLLCSARPSLARGQRFGPYTIIEPLGRGGMGEVYAAEDTRLGRKVALKLLPDDLARDARLGRRFRQEARAAASVSHPQIAHIYEVGESEGQHYIAMEYVEGRTLRARLRESGLLSQAEAFSIAAQICSALSAAHAAGIIHRDIKPENVMLRPDGLVKVLDFGLAKLNPAQNAEIIGAARAIEENRTEHGIILGTTRYMSPEQARGLPTDARTDIWSLGVVLYEMLAGEPPFKGSTPSDIIAEILKSEPPRLSPTAPDSLPDPALHIVRRALQKDAGERYESADALRDDLRRALSDIAPDRDNLNHLEGLKPGIAATEAPSSPRVKTGNRERRLTERLRSNRLPSLSRRLSGRRAAIIATVVAATTLAATAGLYVRRQPSSREEIRSDSIAVLPFSHQVGDEDLLVLADGISENLINRLSRVSSLHVLARSTMFRYKGREVSPVHAGRELGVDHVLSGSVSKQGELLSVQVELQEVATGRQLWGERLIRKTSDLLTMQEEIATRITNELQLKLTQAERRRLANNYTDNVEAYQLYLKGRHFWEKRTKEGFARATEFFQQAIDLDPTYALAYAGLADCYNLSAEFRVMPAHEAYARSRAAVQRALELDETLAESHTSLAWIRFAYDWDWGGSETSFRRALDINPNYVLANHWYAAYLSAMGRTEDALARIERTLELDPLSHSAVVTKGIIYYRARRFEEAVEQFDKAWAMDQSQINALWWKGLAYGVQGRRAEALQINLEAGRLSQFKTPGSVYAAIGRADVRSGWRIYFENLLEISSRQSANYYVAPTDIAEYYSALGETDKAVQWLERGYEEHAPGMQFLKVDPRWDDLRSHPRFAELLRLMKFP